MSNKKMRQFGNKAMRQLGLRQNFFKSFLFGKESVVRSNFQIFKFSNFQITL